MRAGRYAELQLPVIEALHRYEIGLAELPARTVRRCGTEWTFARIGEVTSGADHIMDVLTPNLTHLTEGGREHGLESYRGNKTP